MNDAADSCGAARAQHGLERGDVGCPELRETLVARRGDLATAGEVVHVLDPLHGAGQGFSLDQLALGDLDPLALEGRAAAAVADEATDRATPGHQGVDQVWPHEPCGARHQVHR